MLLLQILPSHQFDSSNIFICSFVNHTECSDMCKVSLVTYIGRYSYVPMKVWYARATKPFNTSAFGSCEDHAPHLLFGLLVNEFQIATFLRRVSLLLAGH
jgi:hypothetical protein